MQTKQRLKGNITVFYKYTKGEKSYLKDDVDIRTNGYNMAMNKLQQEIRRKHRNYILEHPSNRSRGSKKCHLLQQEISLVTARNFSTS